MMKRTVEIEGQSFTVELRPGENTSAVEVWLDGARLELDLQKLPDQSWSLLPQSGAAFCCRVLPGDEPGDWEIIAASGRHFHARVTDPRQYLPGRAAAHAGGRFVLRSPMPGRILRVPHALHDEITAADTLFVIEAMKMQNEIRAPHPGRLAALHAHPGAVVAAGDLLAEIE